MKNIIRTLIATLMISLLVFGSSSYLVSGADERSGLIDKVNIWCRGPFLFQILVRECVFTVSFNHSNVQTVLFLPSVFSTENETKNKQNDNNVEIYIWGILRFNVKVVNNNDFPINIYVNFSMRWLGTGSDNFLEPRTVEPNDTFKGSWDCGPMLHYFTKIEVSAGNRTLIRYGFTLFGFNIFFPNQDEVY